MQSLSKSISKAIPHTGIALHAIALHTGIALHALLYMHVLGL